MSDADVTNKPWGGRFTEATDALVDAFGASVGFDRRLYRHDIAGSIAHARMLCHVGVIDEDECRAICDGLEAIRIDIERDDFSALRRRPRRRHAPALRRMRKRLGKTLHGPRELRPLAAT